MKVQYTIASGLISCSFLRLLDCVFGVPQHPIWQVYAVCLAIGTMLFFLPRTAP
jgi:hypothetical protein